MSKKKAEKDQSTAAYPKNVGVLILPPRPDSVPQTALEFYPQHATIIAYIIAEWTQIEFKMSFWLTAKVHRSLDVVSPMLQSIFGSKARLMAMSAALRGLFGKDSKTKEPLERILSEARDLLRLRNLYAHGHYGRDENGELAIAGFDGKDAIGTSVEKLSKVFDRMKNLSNELGIVISTQIETGILGRPDGKVVFDHPLGRVD